MANRSRAKSVPRNTKVLPERLPRTVGLLGCGVIGGGWAARFILNGVDVRLYSPSSDAINRVRKMLADARRAYRRLTLVPLPNEGVLSVVDSVADAVQGVDLVQESAPERLELKQKLLATASREAGPAAIICSSTSGFRPSLLQAEMDHPECLLVAHPFQPVYLLPLVELCAGHHTAPESVERAAAIFRAVGMHPLVVRKEVDGFIANRLGDAVAREALWLVHDDVATLGEIDDAVRYSWALRRAAMGAYRLNGGADGMRAYMAKWAFKWPWSRLTDKPDLDRDFLDKIAEQAESLSLADPLDVPIEQKRDDLLVAVLQGLRSQHYGPGETLARWEQGLGAHAFPTELTRGSGPLRMPTLALPPDWIGGHGYITELGQLELSRRACGNLLRQVGIDDEYLSKYGSYRGVEARLSSLGTVSAGDRVQVLTHVLEVDKTRLRIFHVLAREGEKERIATGEQMLIHVDAGTGRRSPVQADVRNRLHELARLHAELPCPARAGARTGMNGLDDT
ncbi:3-hydroxyacyl-CoA dehydrogenase NAD-binding domain-containing protein [Bradyrhizobium yuanmingense]|nr:3-hydroxyacyl-CoA dehydrogenase NAD-binding domain-containing protein [Bradyrhizobium yuanmingense]MDF0581962.1 3-hydroxyacyl-CoA dehydrogenase NAD-binding domain-containing protein [Bradyrhizobium yuanmingense]